MERAKTMVDATAVTTTAASIAGWLPTAITIVSGILTIIWLGLRIYQIIQEIKEKKNGSHN